MKELVSEDLKMDLEQCYEIVGLQQIRLQNKTKQEIGLLL